MPAVVDLTVVDLYPVLLCVTPLWSNAINGRLYFEIAQRFLDRPLLGSSPGTLRHDRSIGLILGHCHGRIQRYQQHHPQHSISKHTNLWHLSSFTPASTAESQDVRVRRTILWRQRQTNQPRVNASAARGLQIDRMRTKATIEEDERLRSKRLEDALEVDPPH